LFQTARSVKLSTPLEMVIVMIANQVFSKMEDTLLTVKNALLEDTNLKYVGIVFPLPECNNFCSNSGR